MRKHFEARLAKNNANVQIAFDMVNAWIRSEQKPEKLKTIFEKYVMKGRKELIQQYIKRLKTPNLTLAKWTYDFFVSNADICAKPKTSLNHNDFRRKYLMKLQAETVLRPSFAPLQHFYEILLKFHKKDEAAPQTAQRYIEVWMLLGIKYEDLQSLFMACVHLPICLDKLLAIFRRIFDAASCLIVKDIDPKVMLEYTAMFYKVSSIGKDRTIKFRALRRLYALKYISYD